METTQWLEQSLHLNTETRVPLESLVVSQEGFIDSIRDMFRKTTGKSMKGTDYKPVRLEHTYNFKATVTAISRQYGNTSWLNKQNWIKGKVSAHDIEPYLDSIDPAELLSTLQEAYAFTLKVHDDWLKAYTAYYQRLKPVVSVIKSGLTDDNLKVALQLLKSIPTADALYNPKPRVFPVVGIKIPSEYALLGTPEEQQGHQFKALDKHQVEATVKQLLKDLTVLANHRDAFDRAAFKVVGDIQSRALIQLTHSRAAKVPEGSTAKLEDWVAMASRLDVTRVYWSCEEFAVVRRLYGNVVLAACRWIDRSIV